MRTFLAAIASSLMLCSCMPLAIFAGGTPGYRSSFGVQVTSNQVNTVCLVPTLRMAIWSFEGYFGKKVVMNSGYRTPWHNDDVGGAEHSYHMKCMAADFFIPGVPKEKLIAYARRNWLVGGLGCYPGRKFIHIDVRARPPGSNGPVTFRGC